MVRSASPKTKHQASTGADLLAVDSSPVYTRCRRGRGELDPRRPLMSWVKTCPRVSSAILPTKPAVPPRAATPADRVGRRAAGGLEWWAPWWA